MSMDVKEPLKSGELNASKVLPGPGILGRQMNNS